jgi:hypothetical protein
MLKIKLFVGLLILSILLMFTLSVGIFIATGSVVIYDSAPTPLVSIWVSDYRIRIHIPSSDTIIPYCVNNRGNHGIRKDHLQSGGEYINLWYCP